jgi:hypothetical protein
MKCNSIPPRAADFSLLRRFQSESGSHPDYFLMGMGDSFLRDKAAGT